jgi:ubiquinone/menaquinone biosynthesis C-methylase UbiE
MKLELAQRRYVQQAAWTAQLRSHLLARAGLPNARRALEVGCGTGAVLQDTAHPARTQFHGLDIDLAALRMAQQQGDAFLTGGDAHRLPYSDECFDIVFCHFVLLWLRQPADALAEMRRVTRRGGAVLALAEPDYTQRVDQPEAMVKVGGMQTQALRAQGADVAMGSKLPALFKEAGFREIEAGILQPSDAPQNRVDRLLEIEVLRADLDAGSGDLLDLPSEGEVYVPTYYAWARVF